MPRSIDEWARDRNRSRGGSVGSSIVGAVGGKTGDGSISGSIVGAVGGQSGGSVGGSIAGAVQQQAGQSGGQGSPRSIEEWAQDQQGSRPQSLDAGQRLYEQRKQAQAEAKPWMKTLLWLGEMSNQAEQARLGQQIHPQENATTWEDVKDAWEASRKANRAADYAGRDKLIKEYNAARHEMGAQRHTPEPEVQRRYEQARDRLYEQERIHGNIGLNANGELQTMSYSFGEGVGNVIGGTMGRVIGGVGSAATWLGEAAARSEYAKSAANLREMAAFYAMAGNDNASEGAYRMADTLTQRAAQRGNLAEFGGAYDFFDKQAAAGNRLVQAAKENQRPVVQMGVDVGSTALEMGFDAVSGSPLVSMGVRVFGGASQEAREAGAGFLQQGAYGAASASIEVMTEMIGGLKLYGGGQLDEVLEPALREIAGTRGGYALLRAMYTMAQEGNEEVLSDLLQPLAQSIYNGQSVGENYSQLELQDILYDWLLGAAAAFGGAVVESGGYAQDYTAMREMQQDLNAQGVETGRMTDEQLRQAYTLDKAGVNVAGLQSAENRAVGGETIGEAYENMTPEQRQEAVANMLLANAQKVEQTPTDEITRETAQEILRESLGEREAESAERILDLGSERNLREQAIAYHAIATEYGQTEGRSVEDAMRSNVRGALNDAQVQHAYAYGESLRKSGQTVGVSGQVTEQGAQTAKPARRAGLVTAGTFADGSTTYKAADLSKADARDLTILKDIAKAQGVDIVLYETELGEADAEGRRSFIGANGAYRNGVVYLDINAGLSGERTEGGKTYTIGQRALLVTAAHELTHHLEHSNPTMYRQLRSFVTERLGGSDSFISYVREAMAREDISVEAASREVVARACEEVLLDENAIRELQGKKPTLWEQIKEWVREFVKKFQSPSGEAVEMRQYADELRRLWLDTATQSAETGAETDAEMRTETSTQTAEAEQQTETDTTQRSVRSDAMTDREILMLAAEEYGEEAELAEFRDAMARYQDYDEAAQEHLQKLSELQKERKAVTDMRTSMGEITPQEKQQRLDALDKRIASERGKVSRAEKSAADALSRVTQLEKGRALQDILVKERAAQRQRTRDKASERLLKRDARKAVEKRAKVLYDMLMKNSDKQHVPEMLKEPLGAFLQGLDFSSNRLLNGGEETKRDAKFGAALQKISTMLNDQQAWINGDEKAKNGDFGAYLDISEENLTFLKDCSDLVTEALSENQTFTINQMSGKDLKALSGFLMNLTTAIRNMNNFMANARYESVREAAAADIEHMKALGRASERAGSGLSKTAMWDNGVPYYVLKRFGEGSKAIFDSIAKGWEKMAFNAKEIIDFTAEAYTTKEVNAWKREMHDFTLEDGSEIRMTTAQIMALSALIDREQATKHIEQGGIRIGDIKTAKGEIHDTTHYHLTAADISAIVGSLTERQAEVAGKLQKFMAKKGAEWGNEVSMKRFGYRFYTEGDAYYPIKTDSNDRPMADTDAQENSMFRLLNLSSSKSLNPKASNALIVDDIFDTFADHMADMAKLNGLGLPVLDAIKWFNYKERIDRGDGTYDTKTLQGAMEQAFGKEAQRYFSTLMKDINGVKESGDRGGEWQGKLISNYKVAAIGNSLRVMLLQPTSYVRALTLIKPRYLAGALFSKNAYKEALKYSGTAVWKALGYYDTNISRSMREQIQHSDSFGDQVKEVSMTGAEFGDKWTWGGLWVACKMQTRAEKGLSGEELNRATADLFRNVIYSSQVMDSTLTRSQSMRASGKFTKLKTAFMAEPTLSYNILLDAYSQTSLDMRKYGRSEGWKRNRGKMAHAFAVYAITASFSALVESFVDALRDDDDEELVDKFLDRLIGEVDKAGKRALLKGNLMQDLTIIGKIPELKDLISLFQGYGSRDMSVTALGELKDAYEVWRETILLQKGILDKATKTTYYGNMTLWGKIYKTLTALSHLSGYAVSNLTRDALSLWNTFVPSMKIKTYEGRGASAQAQRYIAAYRAGDRDKMREITESLGADRSGFNSQLSSEIRGDYLAGRITTAQANTMLTELRGLTKIEAQDKLREWDFEKTHGFAYEKLKEQFVEGNVSQAAAVRYIQEVKLKDLDDARNTVLKWQCVKETGIEYDDIKDRLQGGEISVQRAAAYWQKYGGMSAEDATLKANYVAACGATPGLADKLSQTQYKGWYNNVRSAGVKVEVYAEIRSTASTDGNSNVSQAEAAAAITRAINARQLTPAQAQAVWQSFSSSWKTTYAEYIAQNK